MFNKKNRRLTIEILTLVVIGVIMVGSSSRVWAQMWMSSKISLMKRV